MGFNPSCADCTGAGAQINTAAASERLFFGIFEALTEFESV